MFIYGWNMPGYMPDCEPTPCDDWSEALQGLTESLKRHYEEDSDDEESGDHSDQYNAALSALNTAESDSEISVRYGQYVYWVRED